MSGETTLLLLDELCVARWGTGIGHSYFSARDALRGIAADETRLLADWWTRRDAIRSVLRQHTARLDLVPARAWRARLEPYEWLAGASRRAPGEPTIVGMPLARDGDERHVLWIAHRSTSDEDVRVLALASRLARLPPAGGPAALPGFLSSSHYLLVEREEVAVLSAEHGRLLEAYTERCSEALLDASWQGLLLDARLSNGETTDGELRLPLGDPSFRMTARARTAPGISSRQIQTAIDSLVSAVPMPDVLAQIESTRPRRPDTVECDHERLRVAVETSYWMSREDAAIWRDAVVPWVAGVMPRLVRLLDTAATRAAIPLTTFDPDAPGTDGFALPHRGEELRATLYFTTRDGVLDEPSRHRLWQALFDRAQRVWPQLSSGVSRGAPTGNPAHTGGRHRKARDS